MDVAGIVGVWLVLIFDVVRHLGAGPVAQWESVRFTRGRSLVRSQPGPLTILAGQSLYLVDLPKILGYLWAIRSSRAGLLAAACDHKLQQWHLGTHRC